MDFHPRVGVQLRPTPGTFLWGGGVVRRLLELIIDSRQDVPQAKTREQKTTSIEFFDP
jgi:hypothetical protein